METRLHRARQVGEGLQRRLKRNHDKLKSLRASIAQARANISSLISSLLTLSCSQDPNHERSRYYPCILPPPLYLPLLHHAQGPASQLENEERLAVELMQDIATAKTCAEGMEHYKYR